MPAATSSPVISWGQVNCWACDASSTFMRGPAQSAPMPYCPECGSAVQADDAYCGTCGNALERLDTASGGGQGDAPSTGAEDGTAPGSHDAGQGSTDEPGRRSGGEQPESDSGPSRIDIPDDLFEKDTFAFSFKYPISRGYKSLGIGALLILASIFLFPILFLLGYSYRLGRAAALGSPRPPTYDDWWGLLVDGFRLLVTFVIFFVPVGIVYAVLLAAGIDSLAILWYFAAALVSTAIYPTFFGTGSVSGTFRDLEFLRFVATADYWIGYAYMIGVLIALYVGFIVVMLALLITLVGILLWIPLFLVFYPAILYVQAALWGRIYHDAAEEGVVDGPDRPDELASSW